MKLLSTLLLITLLFSSCSKKAGKTSADFGLVLSGISSLTGSNGGAMLWGSHESGASFGVNVNNISGDLVLDLKNGQWNFYMTAWAGGSGDLTGEVKCALATEVFEGGDAQVNLNLLNSTCANPIFGLNSKDNAGTIEYYPIVITSCNDVTAVSGGYCTLSDSNRGYLQSYKITVPDFISGDVGGVIPLGNTPLQSACDDDGAVNAHQINFPGLNLPAGNGTLPIKTQIVSHFGSGCDGTKGVVLENLNKGTYVPTNGTLINGSVEVHHGDVNTEITHIYHLVNDTNACNLSNPNIISIGSGTTVSPFAICNGQQFNSIGDDSTLLSSKLKLLKDIDFSGHIVGIFNPLGDATCGDLGSSVQPIGGLYTDTVNCTGQTLSTPTTDFTGEFYGNNKTLRNIFIIEDDYSRVGLFRKVSGPAIIKDLRIDNIESEGQDFIGALAGEVSGANEISGITITNSYVDSGVGPSYAGGIAGALATVTTLNNLHLFRGAVEGDGDYIGGLFGTFSGTLLVSSFYGKVHSDYDVQNVGGIAGSSTSSNITSVTSKGAITGRVRNAGGIVGTDNSSSIQDSYSEMFIQSNFYGTDLRIGGVVGNPTTTSITDSYFNGKIHHQCNDGTVVNCKVGNMAGTTSMTPSNIISLNDLSGYGGAAGVDFTDYSTLISGPYKSGLSWVSGNWDFSHTNLPPKLIWESTITDPCIDPINNDTISGQISTASRGTTADPIILCNHNQLSNIGTYSDKHYEVKNMINLSHLGPLSTALDNNFQGTIDGNSFLLHSGVLSTTGTLNTGLFNIIDIGAKIKNLTISAITVNADQDVTGVLAGNNKGYIENVEIISGSVSCPSCNMVGGIVGKNEGTMTDVVFNYGMNIVGATSLGGLAGVNYGQIRKATANSSFYPPSSVQKVGGAVGENKSGAVLEEVISNSSFSLSFGGSKIGGVVGENAGIIRDVMYGEHGEIKIKSDIVTDQVGGIVGRHTGAGASVERSISLGKIVSINPTIPTTVGGTLGFHSAPAVVGPKNFYLFHPKTSSVMTRSISSATTTTNCDIDIGVPPAVGIGDSVFLSHANINKVYSVAGVSGNVIEVLDPDAECGNINTNQGTLYEMFGDYFSDEYGITNLASSSSVSGVCQVTASTALQITDNDFIYFNDELGAFRIDNVSGATFDIPDITDNAFCTSLAPESFTEIPYVMTGNTFGQYQTAFHLKRIETFCNGAIPSSDPNFRCPAGNGWDIVEDDPTGTGSNFIRQIFKAELLDEPRPQSMPKWSVEHGNDYPFLLINW